MDAATQALFDLFQRRRAMGDLNLGDPAAATRFPPPGSVIPEPGLPGNAYPAPEAPPSYIPPGQHFGGPYPASPFQPVAFRMAPALGLTPDQQARRLQDSLSMLHVGSAVEPYSYGILDRYTPEELAQQTATPTWGSTIHDILSDMIDRYLPHQTNPANPVADMQDIVRRLGTKSALTYLRGSPSGAFLDQPASTTGDIRWSHLDPSTWYLYNTQPSQAEAPPTPTTSTTLPPAGLGAAMAAPPPDTALGGPTRWGTAVLSPHDHYTALRGLDRFLRQKGTTPEDSFPMLQALLDQGTIYAEHPEGMGMAVPFSGARGNRILDAYERYQDYLAAGNPPAPSPGGSPPIGYLGSLPP